MYNLKVHYFHAVRTRTVQLLYLLGLFSNSHGHAVLNMKVLQMSHGHVVGLTARTQAAAGLNGKLEDLKGSVA
jgi:hypothetical protein